MGIKQSNENVLRKERCLPDSQKSRKRNLFPQLCGWIVDAIIVHRF